MYIDLNIKRTKIPHPFKSWEAYFVAREMFYHSEGWKRLRQEVIDESDGRCVYCHCVPTKDNWIEVDHRIPLHRRWDLRYAKSNLQVTCHRCNQRKKGFTHSQMCRFMGPKKPKAPKPVTKAEARRIRAQERNKVASSEFWKEYLK